MLVLKNWYITNENLWHLSELVADSSAYPIDYINRFFAALRIKTGCATGYAQLLMRPVDWAHSYKADLPAIEGTSIKSYPNQFDNYYWNREDLPKIDAEEAKEIGSMFAKLIAVTENNIQIAVRRLNLCFLRDDDEDSILDATIGIEALLSDDDHQEMTHKLAMRVAALSIVAKNFETPPAQVLKRIKDIYSFRSAVVHGSTKASKKREIVLKDNSVIPTSSLALQYLRLVLEALVNNPKYRKPAKIDEFLLSGCTGYEDGVTCRVKHAQDFEDLVR
ncbi:HEPN domain-containing protein [Geomonas ferrireducens]|uniref:HEPN domain-containing protein n=1 Tax=Geomonas ferrireducens TaxID=2570227 RepID=UPI0010A7F418|nr:HEPN domain-containing protein [Geomonas ferrireducens]